MAQRCTSFRGTLACNARQTPSFHNIAGMTIRNLPSARVLMNDGVVDVQTHATRNGPRPTAPSFGALQVHPPSATFENGAGVSCGVGTCFEPPQPRSHPKYPGLD